MIAAAVFFVVVKPYNAVMARRAKAEAAAPEEPSAEVALLTEIRDLLRTR
jgi:large conductance mechanosensitive channel